MKPTDLAIYLRAFLTHYLPVQRSASPNTVSGYRYAFVLLLRYCQESCNIPVQRLSLEDIDAPRVLAFLDYIENERRGCAQTRNHRLAALHAFFRYVQTQAPEHLAQCQRILAIPLQRISHEEPTYLSSTALAALLAQPDRSTRMGRRDAVLLSVLYDTGARVQELIDLRVRDVHLASPAWVRLTGKGRKTRLVPLMSSTARALDQYLRDERLDEPASAEACLFQNQPGGFVFEVGHPLPAQAIQQTGTGHVSRSSRENYPALLEAYKGHASSPSGKSADRHSRHSRPRGHREHRGLCQSRYGDEASCAREGTRCRRRLGAPIVAA